MKKLLLFPIIALFLAGFGYFAYVKTHQRKPELDQVPLTAITQPTLLELINVARSNEGKPALKEDTRLNVDAFVKAHDQVTRNYWAHSINNESPFQFVTDVKWVGLGIGENIAKNCPTNGRYGSLPVMVQSWLDSPTHHKTMMGDYAYFGYGQDLNPRDNCEYVVSYYAVE